ncbi:unnamed protein product [Schistocephalus solidus]|uniref:DUF4278 domain-containing protein n=1 Tax=Schistocephalus solidus TaxID=70667 RepID=A0A183TQC6_SCHSO|nr:unnamed protein product [Schistocephalus solidus]
MHYPPPNTVYTRGRINVNGAQLKSVYTFMYLGSNLSRTTKVDVRSPIGSPQLAKRSDA